MHICAVIFFAAPEAFVPEPQDFKVFVGKLLKYVNAVYADNQVDYATIYLSIDEVQEYTPVEEPTVWERISGGFVSSIKGVGNGLLDLLVWVLAKSPYLVILGGVTVGVVVLVKKRKARKAAKKAAKQNPTEESK